VSQEIVLWEAVKTSDRACVGELLDSGIDPDIVDRHNNTALIYAARLSRTCDDKHGLLKQAS
jgi:ankyrin repeat protein